MGHGAGGGRPDVPAGGRAAGSRWRRRPPGYHGDGRAERGGNDGLAHVPDAGVSGGARPASNAAATGVRPVPLPAEPAAAAARSPTRGPARTHGRGCRYCWRFVAGTAVTEGSRGQRLRVGRLPRAVRGASRPLPDKDGDPFRSSKRYMSPSEPQPWSAPPELLRGALVDDELDRFKRANLCAYAASRGYHLVRRESKDRGGSRASTASSLLMRHPVTNDKIVLRLDHDGHWTNFSVRDERDNGTIIDFVLRRGTSGLAGVREELRDWAGDLRATPPVPRGRTPTPDQVGRASVCDAYARARVVANDLYLNSRGIRPETLASFRFVGTWRVDIHGDLLFPHRDGVGPDSICGFERKNARFAGFSAGGRKAVWVSNLRDDDDKLVITEAVIDAFSYHQLHPNDRGALRQYLRLFRRASRDATSPRPSHPCRAAPRSWSQQTAISPATTWPKGSGVSPVTHEPCATDHHTVECPHVCRTAALANKGYRRHSHARRPRSRNRVASPPARRTRAPQPDPLIDNYGD